MMDSLAVRPTTSSRIFKGKTMRVNLQEWMKSQQGKHFCLCGCGEEIQLLRNHHSRGIPKFRNGHCSRVNNGMAGRFGNQNPNYGSGKYIDPHGYVTVLNNPGCSPRYVYEHRMVMERHLGRPLKIDEQVHHINGNKLDNRLENLQILSAYEHGRTHQKELREQLGDECYREIVEGISKGIPYKEKIACLR